MFSSSSRQIFTLPRTFLLRANFVPNGKLCHFVTTIVSRVTLQSCHDCNCSRVTTFCFYCFFSVALQIDLTLKNNIMSVEGKQRVITTHKLLEMKVRGEKIAMLTAYDYTFAGIVDQAGIDIILVGDSAANVMAGHETTLPITIDQMIYHAQSVMRAVKNPLVVCDMPFGTYQGNPKEAVRSAIRIMKESEVDAVKLEGGSEIMESVERILSTGIPVMGHLGLTPQSIHKFGTYAVRAKEEAEANKLIEDAIALEKAGCFAIVLEKIPAALAKKVSEAVKIPTIGIGAGPHCDGQVLVMHDMLGLNNSFSPRFLRRYANLHEESLNAIRNYVADVKSCDFPNEREAY